MERPDGRDWQRAARAFLGIAPTHRKIHFEAVDVMRVRNGKITNHWGVGNLLSLMRQIGGWIPETENSR
jgi:predicted ester cyclase